MRNRGSILAERPSKGKRGRAAWLIGQGCRALMLRSTHRLRALGSGAVPDVTMTDHRSLAGRPRPAAHMPANRFDTLVAARRRRARPDDRRARHADLPDHLVRLPRHRSRRRALQHGARGARLFAHLESRPCRVRGAHRGARGRRRRDRHGQRPGGAASRDRDADGRGLAHRGVERALRRLAQPAALHAAALRHRDDVRRPARPRRMARRHPAEHAAPLRRDARQSGARRARHPGSRRSRTRTSCRCSSIPPSRRPTCCSPFEHGADLVYHSATKFLGGHGIDDRRRAGRRRHVRLATRYRPLSRLSPSPTTAFTAWCSPRNRTVAPFLLRARREGLRDFGACMRPHAAFATAAGHRDAAAAHGRGTSRTRASVVEFLLAHPAVEGVAYPELPIASATTRSPQRLLPRGCGRRVQLRPASGDARRRAPLHRVAHAVLAPRERRRRAARS